MTTVEFCEKSLKKASYNSSVYSRGTYGNICAVLGPNPFLWLLPISLPNGDGLTWADMKGQSPSMASADSGPRQSLISQDAEARRESVSAAAEEEPAEGTTRSSRS